VQIADALGSNQQRVHEWQTGKRAFLLTETAERIAAVYEQLSMRSPAPWGFQHSRAQLIAKRNGWPPPLAWDDDEIDDPTATPYTGKAEGAWDLAPCGTAAAARRHHRRGEPLDEACRNASRRAWRERAA
jgi:hypothetical protein